MDVNYMHPEIKYQGMNLRTLTVVIHTIFLETYKLSVNEPIGSYHIQHQGVHRSKSQSEHKCS